MRDLKRGFDLRVSVSAFKIDEHISGEEWLRSGEKKCHPHQSGSHMTAFAFASQEWDLLARKSTRQYISALIKE